MIYKYELRQYLKRLRHLFDIIQPQLEKPTAYITKIQLVTPKMCNLSRRKHYNTRPVTSINLHRVFYGRISRLPCPPADMKPNSLMRKL